MAYCPYCQESTRTQEVKKERGKRVMSLDCIVRNGKLVIPKYGILEADIGIKGEKIVQIGWNCERGKGP